MSSNRESFCVAALVLLLFVAGAAGASWNDEVMAQEPHVSLAAIAGPVTDTSGGSDVLIAVGTLQIVGVVSFEVLALARRKRGSAATPSSPSRVPSPCTSPAPASTSQTRQAA